MCRRSSAVRPSACLPSAWSRSNSSTRSFRSLRRRTAPTCTCSTISAGAPRSTSTCCPICAAKRKAASRCPRKEPARVRPGSAPPPRGATARGGAQIERLVLPYVRGEKKSCIALPEEGAGSDAAGIRTSAERRNGKWVINGAKMWISHARRAHFMIVVALTDPAKGARGGMTAFLVDRETPGVSIPGSYPMIGEYHPYQVFFDNVELGDGQVLGEVGQAFIPITNRLGVRRLDIASRCLGLAQRCLQMMI